MARPTKQGLEYFSFDTDFSDHPKMKMVIAEFGAKGYVITTELLCSIYRHNGYYMEWNDMNRLLFANSVAWCGSSVNLVEQVVSFLVKWEFFDEVLFNSDKILTNRRCQKNFLEGTRKRIGSEILPQFDLINAEKEVSTGLTAEETQKKAEVIPQSKVKESKVKESNKKEGTSDSSNPPPPPKIDFKKLIEYFNENRGAMSEVKIISDSRKTRLKGVISKHSKEKLVEVIQKAKNSNFLQGENDRQWMADFDWITQPKNFIKILEGNYDNKELSNHNQTRKVL